MDRRTVLTGSAALAAGAFVHAPTPAAGHDPLLDAIAEYHHQLSVFSQLSKGYDDKQSDELADATFIPAIRVLEDWSTPAVSHEGAVAALEMALLESEVISDSPMVPALMQAALDFLTNT